MISCDVFLANCNWRYRQSFWELLGAATVKIFSSMNQQKVHHGGWIMLEKVATAVTSCNLVGFR